MDIFHNETLWFGLFHARRPYNGVSWVTDEVLSPARSVRQGDAMNRLAFRLGLCPMDLSRLSMNSLEWANAIARARNAELRALHVVVTSGVVVPEGLGTLERADIMTRLREALITVDSKNAHTGAAVRQGDPGTQILQFAKSLRADVDCHGGCRRKTTDASDGFRHCDSRRTFRLSSSHSCQRDGGSIG
jgi:hypothetical protein